jgi:hypothetical protein
MIGIVHRGTVLLFDHLRTLSCTEITLSNRQKQTLLLGAVDGYLVRSVVRRVTDLYPEWVPNLGWIAGQPTV